MTETELKLPQAKKGQKMVYITEKWKGVFEFGKAGHRCSNFISRNVSLLVPQLFFFSLHFLSFQACSTQLVVQTATSSLRLLVHQLDNTRQNPVTFPVVFSRMWPDTH